MATENKTHGDGEQRKMGLRRVYYLDTIRNYACYPDNFQSRPHLRSH